MNLAGGHLEEGSMTALLLVLMVHLVQVVLVVQERV